MPKGKPVEIVGGGGTQNQIGPVSVPGVYDEKNTGGIQSPEKRTEKGYKYATRVAPEPVEATFKAWVNSNTLQQLKGLRKRKEPFSVSVRTTRISAAKLLDLKEHETGSRNGAHDITVSVREIQQASTGTSNLHIVASTGPKSGKSGGGSGSNVSVAQDKATSSSPQKKSKGWVQKVMDWASEPFGGGGKNKNSNNGGNNGNNGGNNG